MNDIVTYLIIDEREMNVDRIITTKTSKRNYVYRKEILLDATKTKCKVSHKIDLMIRLHSEETNRMTEQENPNYTSVKWRAAPRIASPVKKNQVMYQFPTHVNGTNYTLAEALKHYVDSNLSMMLFYSMANTITPLIWCHYVTLLRYSKKILAR